MKVENGIVCLTFDDRNFDGWLAALPIFAEHNAHASFFVSGEIDEKALATMKALADAGHTVGIHTLHHADAPQYFDAQGSEAFIANEILPQLEICEKAGLKIKSLAYPNNRRDERTDSALAGYFDHFRAGMRDASDEEIFVPLAKLGETRVMRGFGLGEYYSTVESEFLAKIERAAKENACVTFFSHDISPAAKHINLPTEMLVSALEKATELGVKLLGFDELPDFEG